MRRFLTFILLFLFSSAIAQKQKTSIEQVWLGYLNQTRFSNKWGLWIDIQLRTKKNFISDLSQGVMRLGLTYYLNDNTKLTAGYAFFNFFPADGHSNISRPEHRLWQQVQWDNKYQRLRVGQRVRLEERFLRKIKDDDELETGYNFNYRCRYNLSLTTPIGKDAFTPRTLSVVLNDEVLINFGKEIIYNSFDQNRIFIGLAYHINARDQLQFGYMNLFQQSPAGNRYRTIHAARIYYLHNLDFRNRGKAHQKDGSVQSR